MAEIKLSAQEQKNFQLEMGKRASHSHLKHLEFEESGHIGFQKKLTEEQLALIEKVKNKEDVANRVTAISDKSTHEQYPSAKAVYDAVDECGKMELVDSAEITEDVVQISPAINGQYKEIYWVFEILSNNADNTNSEKARLYLFPDTNPTMTGFKLIQQGAPYVNNFTKPWNLCITVKMTGNYAWSELWYTNGSDRNNAYGKVPDVSLQNGIVVPSQLLTKDYLDNLTLWMTSANGGRVFPAGTTYQLWGVRK